MSEKKLMELPIAAIKIPELLLRGVNEKAVEFAELVEDIRQNGVETPINVREVITEGGSAIYYLMNGQQRLGASERVGLQTIPCYVTTCTDAAAQMAMLRLNAHSSQPKPAEYANFLREYLILNPDKGFGALATEINKTPEWIKERLKLTELAPELQKLVDDGAVSVLNGMSLSKLAPEDQLEFVNAAKELPNVELGTRVAERKKVIDAAAKACKPKPAEGFIAFPILRSKPELTALRDADASDPLIAKIVNDAGATDLAGAVKAYINWEWSLDAATVEARRTKFEEDKVRDVAAREEKAAENLRKKEAAKVAKEAAKVEDDKRKVARQLLGAK